MVTTQERAMGDVMILDIAGRITSGVPEQHIADAVRSVLFRGYRKLLINVARATSADASGVSALLGALLEARAVGGDVRLLHVMRRITDLRIIVALHCHFDVFESEAEGIASFGTLPALVQPAAARWLESVAAS